jgi:hypothetical protein
MKINPTPRFLLLALIFFAGITQAQNNALHFDGVDDQVTVPNGSTLIANATGMSMTCWVWATNPAPNYPNFDGIIGFRNDLNADFYLLHLNQTTVECRFRGGSGVFTVDLTGFSINQWNHLALTYDGTTLKSYLNGVFNSSIPASGIISSTTVPFNMGFLPFSANPFRLGGKLDEVSLWNKALSATEVMDIFSECLTPGDPNLVALYRMDQGVANGNNAGINILNDAVGTNHGTMSGFALTGATSNFVEGTAPYSATQISDSFCKKSSYTFGSQTITQPGVYRDTLLNAAGCDSLVELTLTMDSVNAGISASGVFLSADLAGATYQWYNCISQSIVPGATTQLWVATGNGFYAVIVNDGTCVDTSLCVQVQGVGLEENVPSAMLFPNPSSGNFSMQFFAPFNGRIRIISVVGQIVHEQMVENEITVHFSLLLPEGMYWIESTDTKGRMSRTSLSITR